MQLSQQRRLNPQTVIYDLLSTQQAVLCSQRRQEEDFRPKYRTPLSRVDLRRTLQLEAPVGSGLSTHWDCLQAWPWFMVLLWLEQWPSVKLEGPVGSCSWPGALAAWPPSQCLGPRKWPRVPVCPGLT